MGLLTKLEGAGLKLSSVKPLLVLADKLDALGIAEASADKILPLAAKAVDLAPALIPIAGAAIKTPSSTFFGGAAASLVAAVAVSSLPDDSVLSVAAQTAVTVALGGILPVVLGAGGVVVSKLK